MKRLLLLFFILISFSCQSADRGSDEYPIHFKALITKVVDGDTAKMKYHELIISIRFAHIDAPETRGGQAYGQKAKAVLKEWIEGKEVIVATDGKFDGYGRLTAVLYHQGENVNKGLVAKGLAWHYLKYSNDRSYSMAQLRAKKAKKGLWQDKKPTPPWEFRRR